MRSSSDELDGVLDLHNSSTPEDLKVPGRTTPSPLSDCPSGSQYRPLSIINEDGIHQSSATIRQSPTSLRERRGMASTLGGLHLNTNATRPTRPALSDVFISDDNEEPFPEPFAVQSSRGISVRCVKENQKSPSTLSRRSIAPSTRPTPVPSCLSNLEVSQIILDSEFSPTEWREYVAPHNDFPLTPIPLDTDNIEGDSRESAVRFTTQKLQRILQSFLTEDDYPDWVMNEVERHMRGMDRFDDPRT
ncbi:uncharacterized protein EHS24_007449 [Apiotrichum porosum]|uniref:Uncharacterized protein n=1 Tax=Apiotrichum porosum TaxID=105984 RepID=A0A427XUQ5_9TREE|nr:uncharacterized protein EHS24_007449 [Apiotrichum porosum]RSH82471.1 hypothetical protein EHS24_007449 [Apiotrichum porosum]